MAKVLSCQKGFFRHYPVLGPRDLTVGVSGSRSKGAPRASMMFGRFRHSSRCVEVQRPGF